MNINPVVRFGLVPLTAGVAFAVGYALIANPVSSAGARIALPASGQDAQEHSLSYQAGTDAAPDDLRSSQVAGRFTSPETQVVASGEASGVVQVISDSALYRPTGETPAPTPKAGTDIAFQPPSSGVSNDGGAFRPAALIPLAFRPLPPQVAAANPQLANALQGLQQNFVQAIGGQNQNPNDPAYYQRWVAAQANIDEQYRLLVGNQAFLIEQMTVNNQ